jgi:ribosomal protein S24E
MNKILGIMIEAIVVGIITIIIGHISRYVLNKIYNSEENINIYENWNKNYIMEKKLFITGFLTHIICQVSGMNHWYCKNGIACKN